MNPPIEDYALLGDGRTAALVSRDGSVDWLCLPRFDGDACFASLLGGPENGCWTLAPCSDVVERRRRYREDTLIVETDLSGADGCVRLIDFMPIGVGPSSLVRIVKGLRGVVQMRSSLRLRFDYGALAPLSTKVGDTVQACLGPHLIVLRADTRLELHDDLVDATFEVVEGMSVSFVMRYADAQSRAPDVLDPQSALTSTERYWQQWIARFDNDRTAWPTVVRRSLLTIRALTYHPSGAIVAAPTTSLPEVPAGKLNWDYRYCWLRDASFAVVALLNAGFHDEATAWRDWLLRTLGAAPEHIRVMYRPDGSRHLPEWTPDWLPGHRYAKPVRVGNAAADQKQIDVLGEVVDCLHVLRRAGLPSTPDGEHIERHIVEHLERVWNTPSSGIWESRTEPCHYTYSRVMVWVALDRFVRRGIDDDENRKPTIERLTTLRDIIHAEVCREAWNERVGSFTQSYESDTLDASVLLMPLVGFLPADDPRMASTIETIRRELSDHELIRRRKKPETGPDEGAFLACSCWMADCLMMQGRQALAREQFEHVLSVANDVGLFAEEYNTQRKELAGNFPQVLTHLAIINTALGLCGPVLQRGGG
ncbi:alpha,alpha-trehalase (plasmid) [Pararobbsia alpina]|uniref:glycoside hydrolase family 15 protein n=1 Tax=Pararobbsia alpina TaxID=621374 RepID=UPI0039A5C66C